ncbi:MAG: hypothetical protein IT556_11100 [Acetobacteraceae bacterium]|nr:hypothetical protein [Acetobacteraceae bacterium]
MTRPAHRPRRSPLLPEDWLVWLALALCLSVGLLAWDALPERAEAANADWIRKGWWERAYFVSNTLLLGIAALALVGAYFQARAARDQAQEGLQARRANVFLEIQARWSSETMLASRRAYAGLRDRHRRPDGSVDAQAFSDELNSLRETPARHTEYGSIMQVIGLFETVGLLVRRDYVVLHDVWLLVGTTARQVVSEVGPHIDWLRERLNNPRLYAEARHLAMRLDAAEADLRAETEAGLSEDRPLVRH